MKTKKIDLETLEYVKKIFETQSDYSTSANGYKSLCNIINNIKSKHSGSPIGSHHWFNTILSNHKHIGEFLRDKTPDDKTLREWGRNLYETSNELIEWYSSINYKK